MKITFAPKGILQIDEATIIFRNFAGDGGKFNRPGDRNFAILIDDEEVCETLINEGWNVKIKPAREEGDIPFMYLPVKLMFNDRGPGIYLTSGRAMNKLTESSVSCLDDIEIDYCDIDIRPYDWEVNGKTGRTAYLQSIHVYQRITDRFASMYANRNEE